MKEDIRKIVAGWSPLSDRVIIIPDEKQTVTENGIHLSDTKSQEDSLSMGEVIAVGPGRMLECGKLEEVDLVQGDTVLFGRYAGDSLVVDEKGRVEPLLAMIPPDKLLIKIIRQDAILAVV